MPNSYSQDVELEFFEEAYIPWAVEKCSPIAEFFYVCQYVGEGAEA